MSAQEKNQSPTSQKSAAIIIIGNEILSGRTQDKNTQWLAAELTAMGINVHEGRTIPDYESVIVDAVKQASARYDYVFTTGGIGPTHDDITAQSIAACFDTELELNPTAHQLLKDHYGEALNEARLKMAYMPKGARLIENPISSAPSFAVDNVYVMAGIPSIMQAMFLSFKHQLVGGTPTLSKTVTAAISEGEIATQLTDIQQAYSALDLGSYPTIKDGKLSVSIVIRGTDEQLMNEAAVKIEAMMAAAADCLVI